MAAYDWVDLIRGRTGSGADPKCCLISETGVGPGGGGACVCMCVNGSVSFQGRLAEDEGGL